MNLCIGENIKFFRKAKDITQEVLAEMLGISFQSVSRWELGICYPDIELLPILAEIFEVTVDKLLGVDNIAETKKVQEYVNDFQLAISKGEINQCISIARKGVAEYPNNYILLNKLMYALFVSGDEDGTIPEWKENMERYDAEIISLGERIMKYCPDQTIRLEATARLAFQHCEMGRKKLGRMLYETLPSQETCRENQIWWALEEDEKLSFLRENIRKNYEDLKNNMHLLATCGHLSAKDSISVINKLLKLSDLVCDEKPSCINIFKDSLIHYDMAKLYATIGNETQVYEQLELAIKKATTFDTRPEIQSFSSLLLGELTVKRSNFDTADTRPLCEIIRDKWLTHNDFDFIRHTPEFNKIIAMLP